jgi:hypothetical protein
MSETQRPLLRDLITIPERVHQGDFVLKLSEGVSDAHAAETVANYVVTDQLRRAFDEALGFIQRATEERKSAACYLHGSFGSGKSHFMAVLNLLLAGNPRARAIPELAPVVDRHNAWTQQRRFLMVPFHMIGAESVENAVLGGYAEYVRRVHPEARVPGFYLGERLFEDARIEREHYGDEAFFARLNHRPDVESEWGDLEGAWDADSFEAAMLEPPSGEQRQTLVGDLVGRIFTSYADVALAKATDRSKSGSEAFVDIDTGLAIMSQHARGLGYDGVILFLDELILWLATRAADVNFVSAEGAKLSKLVEAQRADRPIPIISFVARQRDLRDLVGANQAGALQLQFADTLKYWEARFDRINLEDRNLPLIAQRRLLKPRDDHAKLLIDGAFDEFFNRRKEVVETLLGSDGERTMFRQVYPFSPALVQALIAASSVLQRERTALKLMLTLLVERRDELRLGSLIPIGDLWDAISTSDQPFSDGMRLQFENARKLWTQKLLPLLERTHNVTWQDMAEGRADQRAAANLRNDARLLKTLLLAALVPEVEALRALTAARLAALNHGSVVSPIPGREGGAVLGKLRSWAAQVGEIKLTDDVNPVISLQITGVDVEPILANAAHYDNDGNRRRKVRDLLFATLGVGQPNGGELLNAQGFIEVPHLWRGTRRQVDLWLESIAELSDERLRGRAGTPTVLLGLPFDASGRTMADHRARLARFGEEADTIAWVPAPLGDRTLRDLGTLLRIDYLLVGSRLEENSPNLSAIDRQQARSLLQNQQSQLQGRMRMVLEAAYGIRQDNDGALAVQVPAEDHLVSFDGTFRPQPPVGATLKEALGALLDSTFAHRFPAHPIFEQEVKTAALNKVLKEIEAAAEETQQRRFIEDRAVRQILGGFAGPLKLGTMNQGLTHFILDDHWANHFARLAAQQGGGDMTVKRLRALIDQPRPMGLPREVENLIILACAAQADWTISLRGAPLRGSIERLDDDAELLEQPLPDETTWTKARERASEVFGLMPSEVRKGATVARLASELREKAQAARAPLATLTTALRARMAAAGVTPENAPRMTTNLSASVLVSDLTADVAPLAVVQALATSDLRTSEAAVGRSLSKAASLGAFLNSFEWDVLAAATALSDHRRAAAEQIARSVTEALEADEHVISLDARLREAQRNAFRLLAAAPPSRGGASAAGETRTVGDGDFRQTGGFGPSQGFEDSGQVTEVLEQRAWGELSIERAKVELKDLMTRIESEPDARLTISWRLTRNGGKE